MNERPHLSDEILAILRCPETGSLLAQADDAWLSRINEAIGQRKLSNGIGQQIEESLEAALLNEDYSRAYPIIQGIPVMVSGEALVISELNATGTTP